MLNGPPGQLRALIVILGLLAVGLFVLLVRRGREVESGFTITGQTRSTFSANAISPPAAETAPSENADTTPQDTGAKVRSAGQASSRTPDEVVVHVAGAVEKPGIYRLPPGSRVVDALKAAGGAKPTANPDAINLAARLEDGTQLYVPTRKEQPVERAEPPPTAAAYYARPSPKPSSATASSRSASKSGKLTTPGEGTVNINTASAEELQRLPGIGPTTAARIIEFRQSNGPFSDPEQLMDVSGIGEKKFEKMKPFVRVR